MQGSGNEAFARGILGPTGRGILTALGASTISREHNAFFRRNLKLDPKRGEGPMKLGSSFEEMTPQGNGSDENQREQG